MRELEVGLKMATTHHLLPLPTPRSRTLLVSRPNSPVLPRHVAFVSSSLPHTNAFPSATNSRGLIHPTLPRASTSSAPLVDVDRPASSQELGNDQKQFSGCKTCGREETEKGCNGEGRIQGGIATVPGFGWWPIKAYRRCPGFVASGGRYRRKGQSMDDVASGGGGRGASAGINGDVQTM